VSTVLILVLSVPNLSFADTGILVDCDKSTAFTKRLNGIESSTIIKSFHETTSKNIEHNFILKVKPTQYWLKLKYST